jgi:hypothetical protein
VPVTFFLADTDLDRLRALDPDRDWRELQLGERAWVLQTWLRLAAAGYPAPLAAVPPAAGLVVFHAKQRRELLRRLPGRQARRALTLVAIRGDIKPVRAADFEVVQNGRSADGRRAYFVPHWPQPGLIARDPARGTTLSRLAYKGFDLNLHPYFRSSDWRGWLAARGIEWVADSVPYDGKRAADPTLAWPDFRDVDAVLAVRPADVPRPGSKPATKLYNAWHAGVPALLSPDPAFAELRQSPLDYLEVSGPEEAKTAVRRLQEEPELHRRMVEHGHRRAAEFTVEAIRRRWLELLEETLPAVVAARGGGWRWFQALLPGPRS